MHAGEGTSRPLPTDFIAHFIGPRSPFRKLGAVHGRNVGSKCDGDKLPDQGNRRSVQTSGPFGTSGFKASRGFVYLSAEFRNLNVNPAAAPPAKLAMR